MNGYRQDETLPVMMFQNSVPAVTRRTYVSNRIMVPFYLNEIRPAFALNTQRLLQLTFWIVAAGAWADGVRPAGINLLAGIGPQDYIVGDGAEGEKNIRVRRWFPPGLYFAVEANNTDPANAHTLDVEAEILERAL